MRSFSQTLSAVNRIHPELDEDEALDLAIDWLMDAAEEPEQEDSPTAFDHVPEEAIL